MDGNGGWLDGWMMMMRLGARAQLTYVCVDRFCRREMTQFYLLIAL